MNDNTNEERSGQVADWANSLGGHGLSECRLLGQTKLRDKLVTLRRVLKVKM